MKEYNFFKQQGAVRPTSEQLLDTKLFYLNAVEIYARFNDWKDNDRFYFTPLYMQMTYSCAGWAQSGTTRNCSSSSARNAAIPYSLTELWALPFPAEWI